MGDLSAHFSTSEFRCKCPIRGGQTSKGFCGGAAQTDPTLIKVLEQLITDLSTPAGRVTVHITSGYRCKPYNRLVGGARDSQHCAGTAADIVVKYPSKAVMPPEEVADYLERTYPNTYGIGRYPGWTHIDVRFTKARWGKN